MSNISKQITRELIDFSSLGYHPRLIEISQKLTYGTVTLGRYRHNVNQGALIGTAQYTVLVNEGNEFEMDCCLSGSDRLERMRIQCGDIQIHPSDKLVYKHWRMPSRMLFIAVDRDFANHVIEDVFAVRQADLEPRIGIRDSVIRGMAEAWRHELKEAGVGGRTHAEALATALIIYLFGTYGGYRLDSRAPTGGISGAKLRRVIEYMEAHLGEDVSLSTLASVSGYSLHHFSQIFKSETGLAPHHFLIERRIHRAKELLLGSDMQIAEIAIDVGFSGQSHFTEHFKKSTGATPLRFRQGRM